MEIQEDPTNAVSQSTHLGTSSNLTNPQPLSNQGASNFNNEMGSDHDNDLGSILSAIKNELAELKITVSQMKTLPPRYDGTYSWPDYLEQFHMISKLNGWNEQDKLGFLAGSLDGKAREILGDNDAGVLNTFEGLVKCLENRFGPSKKEDIFLVRLKNCVQKPNESFPDMAYRIRRLVRYAYPKASPEMIENIATDKFIDVIQDPKFQRLIRFKEPVTLDEALRTAMKLNVQLPSKSKLRNGGHDQNVKLTKIDQGLKNVQRQVQSLAYGNRCYCCKKWGHIRRDCPVHHARQQQNNQ